MRIPAAVSRILAMSVTVLREIRNIDASVAWFTTRFILTLIGGTAFAAFLFSLHAFFLVLFVIGSILSWVAVYSFFYNLKQARKNKNGKA